MALFPKIKKILEQQNACVLSKSGRPEYVVLKWDEFQKISNSKDQLAKLQAQVEAESEEENYDIDPVRDREGSQRASISNGIDINKIPV